MCDPFMSCAACAGSALGQAWYKSAAMIKQRLICLLLVLQPAWLLAAEIQGRVIRVADGDTVTILDADKVQHKIRLAGIDAPEKAQAFGQRSKQSLTDLVAGKEVTVITHKEDRYGRSVGKVLREGRDVNLLQIERGLAWFYRQYQNEQTQEDRARYVEAEEQAREQRLGLWRDKEPVPPWDWRRAHK